MESRAGEEVAGAEVAGEELAAVLAAPDFLPQGRISGDCPR